jgi:hypothetical protein
MERSGPLSWSRALIESAGPKPGRDSRKAALRPAPGRCHGPAGRRQCMGESCAAAGRSETGIPVSECGPPGEAGGRIPKLHSQRLFFTILFTARGNLPENESGRPARSEAALLNLEIRGGDSRRGRITSYRLSRLAWLASRCFVRLRILLLRLDICPPLVAPQTLGLVSVGPLILSPQPARMCRQPACESAARGRQHKIGAAIRPS